MTKAWKIISETLGRNMKKSELPSKCIHEGREIEDPTEIANAFNKYFAHIGINLSSKIKHDGSLRKCKLQAISKFTYDRKIAI